MYSRTILLTAASLAVAGTKTANAVAARISPVAHEAILAALHVHHHRLLSDSHFARPQSGAAEIEPEDGALTGEILM